MLSKELFDEFMLPYYRQLVPELHKRGILAIIDSDGDITESVPWFEEAGLDGRSQYEAIKRYIASS